MHSTANPLILGAGQQNRLAMTVVRRVVSNRLFLLALDELYRDSMKYHERTELLSCARRTAKALSVRPLNIPVEGYYSEHHELEEYFKLIRALQSTPKSKARSIQNRSFLKRLVAVTESGLFGPTSRTSSLLSSGDDPLSKALEKTDPDHWNVPTLTEASYESAASSDDFSLVALAALGRDSVVLAALRESVVLYAKKRATAKKRAQPTFEYVWAVDRDLEARAQKFVATFNDLFDEELPTPCAENVEEFWFSYCGEDRILGRCAAIGFDESSKPVQYYHWAVHNGPSGLQVYDFWEPEVWTTKRYRNECSYK